MPTYMWQASYTAESWAAQVKNPQNRVDSIGRAACAAAGGKYIGGWYCFGDHDLVVIAEMPDHASMSGLVLGLTQGGAVKSGKTTVLMSGEEAVAGMRKAAEVAKGYTPAR